MNRVAALQRVFIDTSELYPFTAMDVLLSLSEDLLFTWAWTDEVLAEWERVIVAGGVRKPESARSVTDAVRDFFGDGRIDPSRYRDRVSDDLSPDGDDRVHAAACVFGDVQVLLTRNIKHFRSPRLAEAGVAVMTADRYLCHLLARHPQAVAESVRRLMDAKTNPPVTGREWIDRLAKAGAPKFAAAIGTRLGREDGPEVIV